MLIFGASTCREQHLPPLALVKDRGPTCGVQNVKMADKMPMCEGYSIPPATVPLPEERATIKRSTDTRMTRNG